MGLVLQISKVTGGGFRCRFFPRDRQIAVGFGATRLEAIKDWCRISSFLLSGVVSEFQFVDPDGNTVPELTHAETVAA